ncbi:MAG: endonuclease V [Candidatus Hermodarchaeota archaeon]
MHHELLQANLSLDEVEHLQEKYRKKLENQDRTKVKFVNINKINWIIGTDISYSTKNFKEWGVAVAVLWNLRSKKMESYSLAEDFITFPYKPGFLGFRECCLMVKAIERLPKRPDVVMCDGHGIIHPKRFGEAVQLGVILDIPTFGVAKNPFIGFSEWETMSRKKGNKTPILVNAPHESNITNQEVLGYAICLNEGMKPVFISVGHKIALTDALDVAIKTTLNHKQPEPLYLADRLSKKYLL